MSTMSHRRTLAAVSASALLAMPVAASGRPPDGAVRSHAAGVGELLKSYDKNAVNGDYAPARTGSATATGSIHREIGPAVPAASADAGRDTGLAWSDAATAAGVALLLSAGLAMVARIAAGRRRPPARISS
jgi:hypothetical protein